jgi:16S rRNA processing protein RimM
MSSTSPVPNNPVPAVNRSFIEIGKIVSTQGLKGEVRVYPDSDFPDRFLQPGNRWILYPGDTTPQPIKLLHGRYLDGKGLYVVQLEGITDRTQAEALKNARLFVPATDRPSLDPDEFHILDLIGAEVYDQANQTLIGTVVSLVPAGNDLLEVRRASDPNRTVLIPFVKAIVPVVDLNHRRIEITPPAGLID